MQYKVAFLDVDGTLLNDDKQLQPATVAAIRRLAARGVKIALATGRHPAELGGPLTQLSVGYEIACNGALVTGREGAIAEKPIEPASIERLAQLTAEAGHAFVAKTRREAFGYPSSHPWISEVLSEFKAGPPPAGEELPAEPIYQALLFSKPEDDAAYQAALPETLLVRFHPLASDVGPAGVTKATGVAALLEHLGVSPDQAIAFGDALNDVEMLSFVGCGVAMGNGVAEAKAAARHVTRSANEDGIAWFLEQSGLI